MTRGVEPDYERRMFEQFGYQRSPTTAPWCLRSLAGKVCRRFGYSGQRPCLCYRDDRRLFDHRRQWRDRDGKRVLTSEPYNFDPQLLVLLVSEVDAEGFPIIATTGPGVWTPETTLIAFRRVSMADWLAQRMAVLVSR